MNETAIALPTTDHVTWKRTWIVARTDLLQLFQARDFWIPMMLLGSIFFVVVPTILLVSITSIGENGTVQQAATIVESIPQDQIPDVKPDGSPLSDNARVSFALAVYLLAPISVVVPLTISTAIGAATIVGEREKGTGEFLAHSPANVREIYGGKLIAAITPGYLTTIVGFGVYTIIVNTVVGPEVGRWFFPTPPWIVLMTMVVPPFLVLALSMVLRLSARVKSTAAAQQASGLITLPLIILAYGGSTGAIANTKTIFIIGCLTWVLAGFSLTVNLRAVTRARLLGVADEQ